MKLNKYFLIGAMGLGLFACNDDLNENGNQDGNQPQEGTTYAAISLKFGNATTARAVGDGPVTGKENKGDGNEADIQTVRLIVADAATNKVECNHVYTKDAAQNPTIDGRYVFAIQPGEKKIYAFVNEEKGNNLETAAAVNNIWDGTTSTVTKKASELGTYNGTSGQGTPFVMSVTKVETWDILSGVSKEQAEAGTKNRVDLNVERMVAKVTVQLADALVADNGFANQPVTLTALTAQIGNADNITYDKNGADDAAKYKSPAESYRIAYDVNGVRQTPEYYNYADNTEDFYKGFERAKLLSGNAESLYAPNATGDAKKNPQTQFYCLENTHATYVQANTTFVSVAATMTANKVVKIAYEKATGTENDNDYVAEKIIPTTNNENTTAGTFYLIEAASDHNLIGGYILESDLADLYGTEKNDITDGNETELAKKAAAVIAELGKNNRGYAFSEPYTNGKGYFNVWVNDLKDADGNYVNKAPVFRNDWYDLTINSIELPGNPTPDIDPEQPLHPDTNIGVTVTIKPWNKVGHNVNLQ